MRKLLTLWLVFFAMILCNGCENSSLEDETLTGPISGGSQTNGFSDDFTICVLPDTQRLTRNYGEKNFYQLMNWIKRERQRLNIKLVIGVGDITDGGTPGSTNVNHTQWRIAQKAYNMLNEDKIPFIPAQGNHDPTKGLTQYFPVSDFKNRSWSGFAGSQNGQIQNSYWKYNFEGNDFIIVTLYHGGNHDWARNKFAAHPNHIGIYVTHSYYPNGTQAKYPSTEPKPEGIPNNSSVFNHFSTIVQSNHNVKMTFSGHQGNIGSRYWTTQCTEGRTLRSFMTAYTNGYTNGKDYLGSALGYRAVVRYYIFKTKEKKVYAYTYDVTRGVFLTNNVRRVVPDNGYGFHLPLTGGTNVETYTRITSPADGAVYPVGADVQITADAQDPDGIDTLNLWIDGSHYDVDYSAPYEFTISGLVDGSHTVMARSRDSNYDSLDSKPITIIVEGTPPSPIPIPGEIIMLQAINGNYVSADNPGKKLIANQTSAGNYETFEVVDAGNGQIGL